MRALRKHKIEECVHCRQVCKDEKILLVHQFLDEDRETVVIFCGQACMMEFFEMQERIQDRVDARIKRELQELHKRVCPACIRRFNELT